MMYLGQFSPSTQAGIDLAIKTACEQFPERCTEIEQMIIEQAKRRGILKAKEVATEWGTWALESPLVWFGVGLGGWLLFRGSK